MIVFAEHTSARLVYILNYIFREQFATTYTLIHNIDEFKNANTPKINYSKHTSLGGLAILPDGLLFEDSIRIDKPELAFLEDFPVVFSNEGGSIPFDVFSAVFWFLSRYEEYQDFNPDTHNRFPASESFAFKNKLLMRPVVDEWLQYFAKNITQEYPNLALKKSKFQAFITIDVDSPWCYKNKGLLRTTGGFVRDFLKGNFKDVRLRTQVLLNKQIDPWFNFEWILKQSKSLAYNLMFFIHVGDYGKFDKTVNYRLKAFKSLVQYIAGKAKVGLHPSYKASNNYEIFSEEIKRISDLTDNKVSCSRQHFLVFSMVEYYTMLNDLSISDDYSMGFADKAGFRAGTSKPFYFFNLKLNQETKLLVHPFVLMDRTLKTYENQSVDDAIITVKMLIDTLKKVDGTFVSLWHNESLSNRFEWEDWQQVYQETIEYLASNE